MSTHDSQEPQVRQLRREKASWRLEPGAAIAEGRSVLEPLGGGRRYEAYLAWDERLHSLTVAKILRPDQVESNEALDDLRREAELLDRFAHPVVVRGFDAVLDGPYPHVLLEHLDGVTLSKLIRSHGKLPLEQLLPLAMHVAAALHYFSMESHVHLDVKPGNIVMGLPPRLIDLSLARSLEDAATTVGPVGTDAYAAPEQCGTGLGPIGSAADIWGFGATLYHAITGQRAFPREPGARESDDPAVRFPQLALEPGPLPKNISPVLESLVFAMLEKDPGGRPTAAEVAAELEPLVDPLAAAQSGW